MQPTIVGAVVALVTSTGVLSPAAAADDRVVLGGGAGIVVGGNYCTLATMGHDHVGDLVGFSAGHCGGPGAPVVAEGADNHGPLGSVAAVGDGLDYGVIKFDPAKVMPTASFAGFAIYGIGPDPAYRQPACTLGAATGAFCGGIDSPGGPGPRMSMSRAGLFQPGDDGGPVTCDGLLVAIILGGRMLTPQELPPFPISNLVKFSAILNDVNAKGGPGAGFSPIPA